MTVGGTHETPARERICVALGVWQIITLAASLATHDARVPARRALRTTLVLTATNLSGGLRSRMDAVGRELACFDRVVWGDDLMPEREGSTDEDFARLRGAVRERLGVSRAAELWLANPADWQERFVHDCYADAPLVVYEDGLHTYSSPWSEDAPLPRRTKATLRNLLHRLRGDRDARVEVHHQRVRLLWEPVRRPHAAYLILSGVLGVPEPFRAVARQVPAAELRKVIDRIGIDAQPGDPESAGPRALVLGSTYSFWQAMSREEEVELYAGIVRRLHRAGYRVCWKEHPRTVEPFLPELLERVPEAGLTPYLSDSTIPLELVLRQNPVELVVAGTSTGLLYAPLLYGSRVRVASFADAVRPLVFGPRLRSIELVGRAVPGLEEVLQARDVEPAPPVAPA
jgi:hypothetical protein